MKKNYIQPTVEVVKMTPITMIAASTFSINSADDAEEVSEALSRGSKSIWDDDEEY